MKIKIVDKKDDVKEMTIEELAGEKYIGAVWKKQPRACKYIVLNAGSRDSSKVRWGVFRLDDEGGALDENWSNISSAQINRSSLLREYTRNGYEIHVFDTAKELYLWMAE